MQLLNSVLKATIMLCVCASVCVCVSQCCRRAIVSCLNDSSIKGESPIDKTSHFSKLITVMFSPSWPGVGNQRQDND